MIEFDTSGAYQSDELPAEQFTYLALMNEGWVQGNNIWTIEMIPREGFILRHTHVDVKGSEWQYSTLAELSKQIEMVFLSYNYE